MDHAVDSSSRSYVFGPFRLDPARRRLERGGETVPLSARAFDLLVVLVQARDRVLSRAEIMARVWPGITVDEHNLSVQMSTLRRALGDTGDEPAWIATLPGRGYRFVGAVGAPPPPEITPPPPVAPEAAIAPSPPSLVSPPGLLSQAGRLATPRGSLAALALGSVTLLVLAVVALWPSPRPPEPTSPRLSIAVMPFRNLTDDGSRPYLADAISDDLTTDLAHIPGSLVIARETADSFKGRNLSVAEIRRALHVRYVLEGSIRAEGAVLHVNAQLIDTQTETHLWSQRFDPALSDLDRTRTDIVSRIASALDVRLAEVEGARAAQGGTRNADAFDLFLQARALIAQQSSLENLTRAQKLLERALTISPNYDDALGELSLLLMHKVQSFDDPDNVEDARAWQDLTRRALAANPRNLKALVARGRFLDATGQYAQARSDYDMALQTDPNNVEALRSLATSAWRNGDPAAAIAPLQKILSIDPEGPLKRDNFAQRGMIETMTAHFGEAIHDLNLAIVGDAGSAALDCSLCRAEFARLFLIAATWESGDQPAARALYRIYASGWPHRSVWRLAQYFPRPQAKLPGFRPFLDALVRAGLPEYLDERQDFHVQAPLSRSKGGDFDPTPVDIPGGRTIDANALHTEIDQHPPLIVDMWIGSAAIPGAVVPWSLDRNGDDEAVAMREIERRTQGNTEAEIVVMGAGVTGWQSYNLGLQLIARGYRHLVWFRGGEEAWVRAGFTTVDLR